MSMFALDRRDRSPRTTRLAALALLCLPTLGCGDDARVRTADKAGAQAPEFSTMSAPAPAAATVGDPTGTRALAERVDLTSGTVQSDQLSGMPSGPQAGGGAAATTPALVPGMIIRNGTASVQVDSLELGIAATQRLATALGGYVGNTSLSSGENQLRSASLELKIPSARYDEALVGLKPLGVVESVSSTAEDVGEEFVDISARVANARRLEERLIALLATRTGKLEDVLAVERELSRVREEIDRYDGRLRYLKSRVATSTLSVTLHEAAPLLGAAPGENVISDAFKDAWRNFVRFVAWFISSLGVFVPLAVLALVGWYGWRRVRRT